ncbi:MULTISPECIES: TAXI family TRAP transporter solute-binding subunit [Micrococcaceae]|uniref:TAXI family TRAP transporter solute-binding subunit n=1 Tax=Micrococcaceae TaxID=1268 RepID=UPI001036109C|nr:MULTISPECIES: TAXI family TRAP transporter solute-binding subunit [Micrococcaceae]TAP27265.1 TAXI family TRAP transporter solute-binding subunit [Arthrobacter sp. S41]UXN31126.1 TAXI family TRAP transporter solute-binding subunit [Glutamicibacter sp. M10]
MSENNGIKRRTLLRSLLGLPLASTPIVLSACSSPRPTSNLVIASGEEGGMYYEFAQLLSTAIEDAGLAEDAQVLRTQATAQNLQLLADGKAQLALGLADTVAQFNNAREVDQQLLALGRIYQNYFHCIVNADSRINTLAELADKRIGTGAPGSGTWVTGQRILKASGLKDVDQPPVETKLGYSAGIHALGQGKIDALFLFGGMPVTALTKLASERKLRLLDVSAVLPKLREADPGLYDQVLIPKNTYPGVAEVNTIGVSNLLMTRTDLPNKTASAIVKMLATRSTMLIPSGSAGIQNLTAETLISTAGQRLHPGAREAYEQLHG